MPVREGDDAFVAVVLGEIGTNFRLHIGQKTALVLEGATHLVSV